MFEHSITTGASKNATSSLFGKIYLTTTENSSPDQVPEFSTFIAGFQIYVCLMINQLTNLKCWFKKK